MPTFVDGYEIDAVITEDHQLDMEITDHPVEKGSDITDHARLKPRVITMECIVSDTPVGGLAIRRGADPSTNTRPDYIPSQVARVFIEGLQFNKTLVTVSREWDNTDGTKGYKAYDNMMVQTIGENISADTGDSFRCKVTFKQVNYVTNNRTTVKVAVPKAKKKLDKGNKPCTEKRTPAQIKTTALDMVAQTLMGNGDNYKLGTGGIGAVFGGH